MIVPNSTFSDSLREGSTRGTLYPGSVATVPGNR